MPNITGQERDGPIAFAVGVLLTLIATEIGAALATIGRLWAGYSCVRAALRTHDGQWPLFLVGGGIFVAVAAVCRWRSA